MKARGKKTVLLIIKRERRQDNFLSDHFIFSTSCGRLNPVFKQDNFKFDVYARLVLDLQISNS